MTVVRALKRLFVHTPTDPVAFWRRRADDPGWHSVMWRNAAYNECAHRDQWAAIVRSLPTGRRAILDLGCGTGRLSGPLMSLFEQYVGVDLDTMIAEARQRNPAAAANYVVSRVQDYTFPREQFDVVLSMACLANALRADEIPSVAAGMVLATRPGGRVILVDPFHTAPALARVGRMDPRHVIKLFTSRGMTLVEWSAMHCIPVRLLLAGGQLPVSAAVTRAAYALGERCLRLAPRFLGDYHVIVFDKPAETAGSPFSG